MLPCVAGKGAPGLVMQAMAKNSAGQQDIRHGVHARPSPAFTSRVHKRPTMASSFNYCRNRSQHTVINSTGNYHVGLQRNLRGKRHVMFNSNNAEAQYVKLLDESDGDGTTSAIEEPQTDVEIPENGRHQAPPLCSLPVAMIQGATSKLGAHPSQRMRNEHKHKTQLAIMRVSIHMILNPAVCSECAPGSSTAIISSRPLMTVVVPPSS